MRIIKTTTVLLLACFTGAPTLAADRPKRKPAEGGEWRINSAVIESKLSIPAGAITGAVWFRNDGNRKFTGESTLVLRSQTGEEIPLSAPVFALDAEEDARGAVEDYGSDSPDRALLSRSLTASDFSLIPIRLLQWNRVAGDGKERVATKSVQAEGQSVEWSSERLGTTRLGGLTHDQLFTRCVRRFRPSGFEIHDYLFTAEYHSDKEAEHYVAYATGYRAIVHPTRLGSDGKRPEGGMLALIRLQASRLDWEREMGQGEALVPEGEAAKIAKKGEEKIVDALFASMQDEGIGDPYDSPALAILRRTGSFDKAAATRLVNIGSPKPLAMVTPLLVEKGFEIDGTKFKKLWSDADDPVLRLLYAAGAQLGGKSDPAYSKEAKLAANSKDPRVLRAALTLATALADPLLAADVEAALSASK